MEAKMGRPQKPHWRKKSMRYSKVEDALKEALMRFESERDKQIILDTLEELKH